MDIYIPTVADCVEEWSTLTRECGELETIHKSYVKKLEELNGIQGKCLKAIEHQKYRMGQIKSSLKKAGVYVGGKHEKFGKNVSDEEKQEVQKLQKEMTKRDEQIREFEEFLPRKNGLYLKIILGNVNVSLVNTDDKFRYKDEYEKFKLIVTAIGVILSFFNLTLLNTRFMDLAFLFLLVWYYCTLTIRESILKVNGSRIKGWWRLHHFISTALAGVLLIWPDTPTYYKFRNQFMLFNCYIGLVQYLQFRYQQGCLYRLKSLGERHNMDITIEGFHSWMWRGLSFLLPFLYVGYLFQLYNAYTLYQLSFSEECKEWQVPVLSLFFFMLFLGNTITTSSIIPQKLKEKLVLKYRFATSSSKKESKPNNNVNDADGSSTEQHQTAQSSLPLSNNVKKIE